MQSLLSGKNCRPSNSSHARTRRNCRTFFGDRHCSYRYLAAHCSHLVRSLSCSHWTQFLRLASFLFTQLSPLLRVALLSASTRADCHCDGLKAIGPCLLCARDAMLLLSSRYPSCENTEIGGSIFTLSAIPLRRIRLPPV